MIVQFSVTYYLSTSLEFFWTLINSQVNFIYLPMLSVNPPGQVIFYFNILILVCTFDPIPLDIVYEVLPFWDFDKVGEEHDLDVFKRIEIEDKNIISVLGSMIIFVLMFIVSQFVYLILKPFKASSLRVRKVLNALRVESAYRTILIIFFIEAYMDLLVGGMVVIENS